MIITEYIDSKTFANHHNEDKTSWGILESIRANQTFAQLVIM